MASRSSGIFRRRPADEFTEPFTAAMITYAGPACVAVRRHTEVLLGVNIRDVLRRVSSVDFVVRTRHELVLALATPFEPRVQCLFLPHLA
jgi:hypothetical protein